MTRPEFTPPAEGGSYVVDKPGAKPRRMEHTIGPLDPEHPEQRVGARDRAQPAAEGEQSASARPPTPSRRKVKES